MLDLVVYSRRGCHLCEQMLEELVPLCRDRATIRVLDVDSREDWQLAFGSRVPVLCNADREVSVARLDRQALFALLDASR
ncbi:MAG: glutaredoxin family protein [Chromatiales bacterium]|nr:MAG: glutaredoxin family protein [Chromatiales bacterium]